MRTSSILIFAASLALTPSASFAAGTKQKAVMLEFTGWNNAKARSVAVKAVSRVVQLVPKKHVKLAIKMMDSPANTPAGVTKLLGALEVPFAIEGTVTGEMELSTTTIQIFARDGRRLAKWTGGGPSSPAGEEDIAIGARDAVKEAVRKLKEQPIGSEPLYASAAVTLRGDGKVTRYRRADEPEVESEAFAPRTRPATDKPSLVSAWSADTMNPLAAAMAPSAMRSAPAIAQPAAAPQVMAAQPSPAAAPAPQELVPSPDSAEKKPFAIASDEEPAPTETTPAKTERIKAYDEDDAPSISRAPSGRAAFSRAIIPKDEIILAPTTARTLSALAGVTFRRRIAELKLDNDSTARHDTGMFPELTLFARTRPFAKSHDALGGVFADLEGAYAIGLSARQLEDDATVGTQALRLRFQAGWMYEASGFAAGASLGFGMESMALSENAVIGSSNYTFLRPGLVARAEIYNDAFAIELDAGYRAILQTGEVGDPYGQTANAMGFDATARLCGAIDLGVDFSYAVQVGYERHLLAFGAPKDDPGTRALAVNGSDSSILATAVFGIAFR